MNLISLPLRQYYPTISFSGNIKDAASPYLNGSEEPLEDIGPLSMRKNLDSIPLDKVVYGCNYGFTIPLKEGTLCYDEFTINRDHPFYQKIKESFISRLTEIEKIPNTKSQDKVKLATGFVCEVLPYSNFEVNHFVNKKKEETAQKYVDFGDILENGNGVCRHRAILFKLLCDDVLSDPKHGEIYAAVRSGELYKEGHAWNIAKFKENGQTRFYHVDQTSPVSVIEPYTNSFNDYTVSKVFYKNKTGLGNTKKTAVYNPFKLLRNQLIENKTITSLGKAVKKVVTDTLINADALSNTQLRELTLSGIKTSSNQSVFSTLLNMSECTLENSTINNFYLSETALNDVSIKNSDFSYCGIRPLPKEKGPSNSLNIEDSNFKHLMIRGDSDNREDSRFNIIGKNVLFDDMQVDKAQLIFNPCHKDSKPFFAKETPDVTIKNSVFTDADVQLTSESGFSEPPSIYKFDQTNFKNSKVFWSQVFNAEFNAITFDKCAFNRNRFKESRFENVTFKESDLEHCTFEKCTFDGLDFEGTTFMQETIFRNCKVDKASYEKYKDTVFKNYICSNRGEYVRLAGFKDEFSYKCKQWHRL